MYSDNNKCDHILDSFCACNITKTKLKMWLKILEIYGIKTITKSIKSKILIKLNHKLVCCDIFFKFLIINFENKKTSVIETTIVYKLKENNDNIGNEYKKYDEYFNNVIKVIGDFECYGHLCFKIRFNKNKYKSLLGLPIESNTNIISSNILSEDIGEMKICGLELSFNNSKIGLDRVFSHIDDQYINVKVNKREGVMIYNIMNNFDNMIKRALKYSEIFIGKKEV